MNLKKKKKKIFCISITKQRDNNPSPPPSPNSFARKNKAACIVSLVAALIFAIVVLSVVLAIVLDAKKEVSHVGYFSHAAVATDAFECSKLGRLVGFFEFIRFLRRVQFLYIVSDFQFYQFEKFIVFHPSSMNMWIRFFYQTLIVFKTTSFKTIK